jgi:hypothetical protein
MGIDSASGSLATNVAGEGDAHTPTWRLGEEGPREGRDLFRTRSVLRSGGNRRTLHTRPGRPTPNGRRAQNQSHRLILLFISQKQNPYLPIPHHQCFFFFFLKKKNDGYKAITLDIVRLLKRGTMLLESLGSDWRSESLASSGSKQTVSVRKLREE